MLRLLPLLLLLTLTPEITLQVQPHFLLPRSQVVVKVVVEKDEGNRELAIEWYIYPEFRNKKVISLDGLSSPRIFQYYFQLNEPGEWTFEATVSRSSGSRTASATVKVIDPSE